MKTLYLLRHAKSDWGHPGVPDHDRPLNGRGKRARRQVAQHVAGRPVDLVVCSTAKRARSTAKPVIAALACPVRYEAGVYAADPPALVALVRSLPQDAAAVLLVGHNPSMEDLTAFLCGTSPPYRTSTLGTIELDVQGWPDVGAGCGTLTARWTPGE